MARSGRSLSVLFAVLLPFGLLLLVVSPESALAQEPDRSTAAALKAAEVVEQHCAEVAAGRATESAQALSAVGPVLAEVSAAHDTTRQAYLLYWRGRLNLCLDREERAQEDLSAFVAAVGEDATYRAQVREARALLRRLTRAGGSALRVETPGAVAAGGALLGMSAALGGLSAWQWQVANARHAEYLVGERPWSETEAILGESAAAQTGSRILLGLAVGAGVGGIVSFVLSTVAPRSPTGAAPAAVVLPLPSGGVAFSLEAGW